MNTMPEVVKAAVALADSAIARERLKRILMERRESGNTCTREYEDIKSSYKVAKRRYRAHLATYTTEKAASA